MAKEKAPKPAKITGEEKKQFPLFRKRRGGVVLTKDEVRQIKKGRKKLRKEMRQMGIKSRKEFELTASGVGLYFDKNRFWALLWWFLGKYGAWLLGALALLLMLILLGVSWLTEFRGHFTISMSGELFRQGFSISETEDFANPLQYIFSTPAEGVPCISIYDIPQDVDQSTESHDKDYFFAKTFYIRNEGDNGIGYDWELRINAESQELSKAAWVMVFEDGEMMLYAELTDSGEPQALPAFDDDSRGYSRAPLKEFARYPDEQYEIVAQTDAITWWRVIPMGFESDKKVCSGEMLHVQPMEVHKYTVVIWLEGDDPDCTNDLIGSHIGMDWYFTACEEAHYNDESN